MHENNRYINKQIHTNRSRKVLKRPNSYISATQFVCFTLLLSANLSIRATNLERAVGGNIAIL